MIGVDMIKHLYKHELLTFCPRVRFFGKKENIAYLVEWCKHAMWTSQSCMKLCRKTVRNIIKKKGIYSCGKTNHGQCNQDSNCIEIYNGYQFLHNATFVLKNVSNFLRNMYACHTGLDICIALIDTIIDVIKTLQYAICNCVDIETYLKNPKQRYQKIIYDLIDSLTHFLVVSRTEEFLQKFYHIELELTYVVISKLQSIQHMAFFRNDLMSIAINMNRSDHCYGLLEYILTMVSLERKQYKKIESCADAGTDIPKNIAASLKYKSFVDFLFQAFDCKLMKFIIKYATNDKNIDENAHLGLNCVVDILSIITQENYICKSKSFGYICKLFDIENGFNILATIVKWLKFEIKHGRMASENKISSDDYTLDNWDLTYAVCKCVAIVVKYQINCLTDIDINSNINTPNSKNMVEYGYPYSNKKTSLIAQNEFIDDSTQQVTMQIVESNLNSLKGYWNTAYTCQWVDDLHYDLQFYRFIRATNGTPNSLMITAIKSMNRKWTADSVAKTYIKYYQPNLKSLDFFDEYPWLLWFNILPTFLFYARQKKWNKTISMLETIDHSMHQVIQRSKINTNNVCRQDVLIWKKLMIIVAQREDSEIQVCKLSHPNDFAQQLTNAICEIRLLYKYGIKNCKARGCNYKYNYHTDNVFVIHKLMLGLKRMVVNWLPDLLALPSNEIANDTDGMYSIHRSILCCVQCWVIEKLKDKLNLRMRTQSNLILSNDDSNDCDYSDIECTVWDRILNKCCFRVLKKEDESIDDFLARLWRTSGILKLYHLLEFDLNGSDLKLNSIIYCFRQALKLTKNSFDKIECVLFLIILNMLNENKKVVSQLEKKIMHKNTGLISLVNWIKQNMIEYNYNEKHRLYGLVYNILQHNHNCLTNVNNEIDSNYNDTSGYDFLKHLKTNASLVMKNTIKNETNVVTMCNVMAKKQCNWKKCKKKSVILRRCSKCKSRLYCSKKCQKRDWISHKQYCCTQ